MDGTNLDKDGKLKRAHVIPWAVCAKVKTSSSIYKDTHKTLAILGSKSRIFFFAEKTGFDNISYTVPHSDIECIYVISDGKLKSLDVQEYLAMYSSLEI